MQSGKGRMYMFLSTCTAIVFWAWFSQLLKYKPPTTDIELATKLISRHLWAVGQSTIVVRSFDSFGEETKLTGWQGLCLFSWSYYTELLQALEKSGQTLQLECRERRELFKHYSRHYFRGWYLKSIDMICTWLYYT